MAKNKKQEATGSLQIFHAEFTTTVNGQRVTKVITDVNQRLINGEWVDVDERGRPIVAAKRVASGVVKSRRVKEG